MTKKEFIETFGENPEDMFGSDWHNELQDLAGENKFFDAQDVKQEKAKNRDAEEE